jgi:serine/threonine-protein kinase
MALLSKSTAVTEDTRAFLQSRIGLFGLIAGSCYLFFLLYRLSTGATRNLADPSLAYHLASGLVFLGVWIVCRLGTHSVRVLRVVEVLGLLIGSGAIVMMGGYVELHARPDQVLLLALSSALTARAIYVPSSATRTFFISLAVGIELVVGVYFIFLEIVPARWETLEPGMTTMSPEQVARALVMNTAAWWAITLAITTGASHVIYGLRREIRDARQLGQYRLEYKIGEGGMGTVYRASHALLRRPTAVKLLRQEGGEEQRHFESEVQHTARLSHSNIITIFDYGHTADGVFYYAMELLDGASLERLVDTDGPQPVGRVLRVLEQIGAALVHAHGEGLIHRDIKPANIMLFLPHRHGGQPEQVKLLDFGLVKELKDAGGIDVTHANAVAGTPQYMCPEAMLAPRTMDGRSDLYNVGAVAFYLLTGRHLFEGETAMATLGHHMHTEPPRTSAHAPGPIPEALDQLIWSCVSKNPDERPETALAFLQKLARIPDGEPWTPASALEWWQEMGPRVTPTAKAADGREMLTLDVAELRQRAPDVSER